MKSITDSNVFIEVKKDFAKEMVVGFLKLNGATIGAVANRTAILDEEYKQVETFDGTLTADGCKKAEEFVRFPLPAMQIQDQHQYALNS